MPCVLGFNVWSGVMPFGEGSGIMDLEDFIVSNNLLPLGSMVYLTFCTRRYGWGWDNFIKEADAGEGMNFPNIRGYVTYILPLIVLGVYLKGYWDFFKGFGLSPILGEVIALCILAVFAFFIFYRKKDPAKL
jgi:NSS family neurotransmitter:Na+ symporter